MQKTENVEELLRRTIEKQNSDLDFKIAHRQEFNYKILENLKELVDKFPEFRFWQVMCALGYETNPDRFYEESYDTLQQIEAVVDDFNKKNRKKNE